tara:strand:- start:10064 stop:10303 length:240 start_codon:yes stop_codon:yes gene_type:complete
MDLSNLILNALLKDAQAQEAKAIAILQNYMANSAGIGEHPDIVEECKKQVKDIADARETIDILNSMVPPAPTGETEDGQ